MTVVRIAIPGDPLSPVTVQPARHKRWLDLFPAFVLVLVLVLVLAACHRASLPRLFLFGPSSSARSELPLNLAHFASECGRIPGGAV